MVSVKKFMRLAGLGVKCQVQLGLGLKGAKRPLGKYHVRPKAMHDIDLSYFFIVHISHSIDSCCFLLFSSQLPSYFCESNPFCIRGVLTPIAVPPIEDSLKGITMPSQLTRHVFRQMIRNELYSNTLPWFPATHYCLRARRCPLLLPSVPRRTLFGFGSKAKRQPKPVDYQPGFETMMDLSNRLSARVRAPPSQELAQAFVDLFHFKQRLRVPLDDIQARYALETFRHLQTTYTEVPNFGLTGKDLRMALKMLKLVFDSTENHQLRFHNELARALFEELKKRRETMTDDSEPSVPFNRELVPFIQVMAQCNDALYARDLTEEYWETCIKPVKVCLSYGKPSLWPRILKGLIRENRVEELQKTIEIMQKYDISFDPAIHGAITVFYAAGQADMEMTKKWYQHPIADNRMPTVHTDATVLKLCISQNELDWGDHIFKSLVKRTPEEKAPWDVILQWAAAKGRSVDEIERMMKVMERRQKEKDLKSSLDMETINGLVELANSRSDPYTAERYVALGQKWGFVPNARTYLLQLEYRIKIGDLGGARTAYARLQAEESVDSEDLPLINKLIIALCAEKSQNYDAIMGLVEDLGERKAHFEPETVAVLSLLHLQRGEMDDLVDLLNTHAFNYGLDQRSMISQVLLFYILDHTTAVSRAWETYNVLRQTFSEIDISSRTSIMQYFFTQKRSDMATHVFNHMRKQHIKSLRPTVSTYVACLSGIAKAKDLESLETVHNMMKLDTEIDPNTQLYNALMLAYASCGDSFTAHDFWEDIVHSREGPSYASIQIALMACEISPVGERVARDIWARLKRFEIEVTREIYAAYVGSLAGNRLFGECVKLINDAEKEVGYKPDALL